MLSSYSRTYAWLCCRTRMSYLCHIPLLIQVWMKVTFLEEKEFSLIVDLEVHTSAPSMLAALSTGNTYSVLPLCWGWAAASQNCCLQAVDTPVDFSSVSLAFLKILNYFKYLCPHRPRKASGIFCYCQRWILPLQNYYLYKYLESLRFYWLQHVQCGTIHT